MGGRWSLDPCGALRGPPLTMASDLLPPEVLSLESSLVLATLFHYNMINLFFIYIIYFNIIIILVDALVRMGKLNGNKSLFFKGTYNY